MFWTAIGAAYFLLGAFVILMWWATHNAPESLPPEYRIVERRGRFRAQKKIGKEWDTCHYSGCHGSGPYQWGTIDEAREWIAEMMDDYETSITLWEPVAEAIVEEQPCESA